MYGPHYPDKRPKVSGDYWEEQTLQLLKQLSHGETERRPVKRVLEKQLKYGKQALRNHISTLAITISQQT